MKNLISYLLFVFLVVFLFGAAYSLNTNGPDAKNIFTEKKCVICHSVEAAGIESKKKDPVDLSKVGDTYDADFISKFITKQEKIDGKEHKILVKGSDEELKTLTEWLASLKSKETGK
jgi:cytochrome c551/c552